MAEQVDPPTGDLDSEWDESISPEEPKRTQVDVCSDDQLKQMQFIFQQPELSDKEKEMAIEEICRGKSLCILVFGLMGIGKSTLLNGIIGRSCFEVGDTLSHQTPEIEKHILKDNQYTLTACDTPGLNDSTGMKDEYIKSIQRECESVDVFLYCMKITSTRVIDEDLRKNGAILKELNKAVKPDVWEHCVIVLTWANSLVLELQRGRKNVNAEFKTAIDKWKTGVRGILQDAGIAPSKEIVIILAGAAQKPSLLGDSDYWLSDLFESVFDATSSDGQDVLTHFNQHRIKPRNEVDFEKDFDTAIEQQPIVQTKPNIMWKRFKEKFPTVAAALGVGGVGGATGATVGAVIGALAIGLPTFGIAAGVGLALGAVIGGGSGIGIGILTAKVISKVKQKTKAEN